MMRRRQFISATLASTAAVLPRRIGNGASANPDGRLDFDQLRGLARELAERPYERPNPDLPRELRELDQVGFHSIRFRTERAFWRGESLFEVQLLHPGSHYDHPVAVNLLEGTNIRRPTFSRDYFDYGNSRLGDFDGSGLGFAGLRLHYPLHRPDYADELVVFLGATYFRLLARNQHYGLSARGLAVNTALPKGEEFPLFREFWLERPPPESTAATLFALLDSPSVTGAYRFVIRPGASTELEVVASLYPRQAIEKLGIAPLTSMFLFGETASTGARASSLEVHDSDGLLLQTATGEWIWRPLVNPRSLRVSAFLDDSIRGFGLLQRDRNFASYQDLDFRYDARPSLWVEPLGDWGPGQVELVEIPSEDDTNDNIVAYWVPRLDVNSDRAIDISYRLHCFTTSCLWPPAGFVAATRISTGRQTNADRVSFEIDFDGGELTGLAAAQPIHASVTTSAGLIDNILVRKNSETAGWRVAFALEPDGATAAELRCFLHLYGNVLSETWSFLWKP